MVLDALAGFVFDLTPHQLFSALSETLHNQLRQVTNEKHEMTEEAHRLVKTIRQMEDSLEDNKPNANYETHDDGTVTYPLTRCLQGLKEKYNSVSRMHRERFEQVRKLAEALESYASHLETSFVEIKLSAHSAQRGHLALVRHFPFLCGQAGRRIHPSLRGVHSTHQHSPGSLPRDHTTLG